MSSQTILQQPTLLENASKHRAYHETDISTWYRAGTQDFIEGDINLGYVKYPDPTGKRAFDLKEFNEKKEKITNPLEKAVLGWKGEHLNERQKYVEETARAAKEDRSPRYNEIITAETFSSVKSIPRLITIVSMEQQDHDLLSTIRVENTNDFNGIKILDVQNVGEDLLQLQGEFTIPKDIPSLDILSYTLNTKRWGFRTAFSYELGLVNLDIQNLDNLLLNALAGKIELRRTKDVAAIINAVGNTGSQANWKTLTATDHFTNYAYDDIREAVRLINDQYINFKTQFAGMHPDVFEAFYRNMATTQLMGQQNNLEIPFTNTILSTKTSYPAFPGLTFVEDSLFTTNRFFTWNQNAIWQLYGGIRTVPFENREVGYYGTNTRTYFNTALIKSNLIYGATGVIA